MCDGSSGGEYTTVYSGIPGIALMLTDPTSII